MTLFRYEAIDRSGKVVRGAMDAANEQAVSQRLASMGYSLKVILSASAYTQSKTGAAVQAAGRPVTGAADSPVSVQSLVPLGSLARFYRQLATLVRSGMPLIQALDELQAATSNLKLKHACSDMKDRVQRGEKLSAAMAAFPELFPVHTTGLVWGGELGGYLDIALDEAATEIEQEYKDSRLASIGWWLVKGNFVLFILFIPIFNRRLGELLSLTFTVEGGTPAVLKAMAARYIHGFAYICIPIYIAWIVLAIFWSRFKRRPAVRRWLDSMILRIPPWGGLHRARAQERFLKSLYRQYESAVPPAQGWAAASMSVRNSELAGKLRMCEEVVRRPGGTLQQAFVQSGVFSQEDAAMVSTGERSGIVSETLQRLSGYQGDAASSAKSKGRVASVHAFILALILPVGFVAIMIELGCRDFFSFVMKWLGL